MRAATRRYARGDSAALPFDVRVSLVAARYGQAPDDVRGWAADDFQRACALLKVSAT